MKEEYEPNIIEPKAFARTHRVKQQDLHTTPPTLADLPPLDEAEAKFLLFALVEDTNADFYVSPDNFQDDFQATVFDFDALFKHYCDWWCKQHKGRCNPIDLVRKGFEDRKLVVSNKHIEWMLSPALQTSSE